MKKPTIEDAKNFVTYFKIRTSGRVSVEYSEPFADVLAAERAYDALTPHYGVYYDLLQYFVDGSSLARRSK